jgi:hypothetical protein
MTRAVRIEVWERHHRELRRRHAVTGRAVSSIVAEALDQDFREHRPILPAKRSNA